MRGVHVLEIIHDELREIRDILLDAAGNVLRQQVAAVAAEVSLVVERRADVLPERGPHLLAHGPLVDQRHMVLRGKLPHGARPRADGVAVAPALHRRHQHERGALAPGLRKVDAEVGLEGRGGLGVALRPLRLRVVMGKLDQEKVIYTQS